MDDSDEYYGTPQSVAAMKRSAALWLLVRGDPRFAYYGRLVGLSPPVANTAEVLAALARLQGAAPCYFYPKAGIAELFAKLEGAGLSTDRHEHFIGGETAYTAAKQVLSTLALPPELGLRRLDEATPGGFIAETVDMMEASGVMPVPASFFRGKQGNGICLVATEDGGRPVSVVASFFPHAAGSPHTQSVFWGMITTRPDWRGRKIAMILGALAIVHMWEEKGARAFMTGVRHDNASSTILCNRLGVVDSEWAYANCIDPQTLGRNTITK